MGADSFTAHATGVETPLPEEQWAPDCQPARRELALAELLSIAEALLTQDAQAVSRLARRLGGSWAAAFAFAGPAGVLLEFTGRCRAALAGAT